MHRLPAGDAHVDDERDRANAHGGAAGEDVSREIPAAISLAPVRWIRALFSSFSSFLSFLFSSVDSTLFFTNDGLSAVVRHASLWSLMLASRYVPLQSAAAVFDEAAGAGASSPQQEASGFVILSALHSFGAAARWRWCISDGSASTTKRAWTRE